MGRAMSMDLRVRVVKAIDDGLSTREAARRFAIGIATAGAWLRLWRRPAASRPLGRVIRFAPSLTGMWPAGELSGVENPAYLPDTFTDRWRHDRDALRIWAADLKTGTAAECGPNGRRRVTARSGCRISHVARTAPAPRAGRPSAEPPKDVVDPPPVIHPGNPTHVVREQRDDDRLLRIRQIRPVHRDRRPW